VPREAEAISSWKSQEEAFVAVAKEIQEIVSISRVLVGQREGDGPTGELTDVSLDLVRGQIRAQARLYERTRQRMRASDERTARMEQIFSQMRALATASFHLLDELAGSPSPGDRLAAVAILQVFSSDRYLDFLVRLVGSEKPFIGYQATKALGYAVSAIDPQFHERLLASLEEAQAKLEAAAVGSDTDRQTVLRSAITELKATIASLASPALPCTGPG
jgi:uncharacterized protein (DUF1810 family)